MLKELKPFVLIYFGISTNFDVLQQMENVCTIKCSEKTMRNEAIFKSTNTCKMP